MRCHSKKLNGGNCFLFLVCFLLWGQTGKTQQGNFDRFNDLFDKKDTVRLALLLSAWEKENPNDPELYTSAFNYYILKSQREIFSIQSQPSHEASVEIKDSTGKRLGYMNSRIFFDEPFLDIGLRYADEGIRRFPNRLDIRFGKCYVFKTMEQYDAFTRELIQAIDYSVQDNNNWLWTQNQPVEGEGRRFFLDNIQTYLQDLFESGNDSLLNNMQQIGEATLKYYPDEVEILNSTALPYLLHGQPDKALVYLKHAEQFSPEDPVVLNSLAHAYAQLGDKATAIAYCEKLIKYGDEDFQKEAKRLRKELK